MTKVEVPATWHYNRRNGALEFYRRRYIDESELHDPTKQPPPDIVIDRFAYYELKDWMAKNEHDLIKTDRTEDLKIIHKLLDILAKKG